MRVGLLSYKGRHRNSRSKWFEAQKTRPNHGNCARDKSRLGHQVLVVELGNSTSAIAHPANVLVLWQYRCGGDVVQRGIDSFCLCRAKRSHPFVNFRMTIGKGKSGCAIVVRSWLIYPGSGMGIEEASVVNTTRMLI